MKKILIGLLVAAFTPVVVAQTTGFETVEDLVISANGKITVSLSGPVINPNSCPQSAYVIDADAGTRSLWLAQLMTAKAADQNVKFGINSATCANNNKSPAISIIITE